MKVLAVSLVHPLPALDSLPGVCDPHWQHQGGAAPRPQYPPGLLGQGHSWHSAAGLTLEGNSIVENCQRKKNQLETEARNTF